MRQKLMLLFFSALTLLLGCKKKPQYSYWTVNGNAFSSNDIDLAVGKAVAGFASKDFNNRFNLEFMLGYLPIEGNWSINPGNNSDPNRVFINFYYQGKFYIISPNIEYYLEASKSNNKATYRLNPAWFVNYDNANDSVLISGIFNEP